MNVMADRGGLKDVSALLIDAQFCQQYGTQLFSYQGEKTEQYQQLCLSFTAILDDVLSHVDAIKSKM